MNWEEAQTFSPQQPPHEMPRSEPSGSQVSAPRCLRQTVLFDGFLCSPQGFPPHNPSVVFVYAPTRHRPHLMHA